MRGSCLLAYGDAAITALLRARKLGIVMSKEAFVAKDPNRDAAQAAADAGELERAPRQALEQKYHQQIQGLVDRRWIVSQVVEIAKHNPAPMTATSFKDWCETIARFIAADRPG